MEFLVTGKNYTQTGFYLNGVLVVGNGEPNDTTKGINIYNLTESEADAFKVGHKIKITAVTEDK